MTVLNTETGELLALDRAAAERRAERIRLRLDSIADSYTAVMPMIREAIEKRDDLALGYRSVSEYVSDRFGGALTRLGVEVRREVVRELTEAGMSTRAIAPIVGVSQRTVVTDQEQVSSSTHLPESPAPTPEGEAEVGAGHTSQGEAPPAEPVEEVQPEPAKPRPAVTGIDGKEYARPEPKAKPNRKPLPDVARTAGWELRKSIERLERIAADDRFKANQEAMAPLLRGHLTNAIEVCQDLLDRIDN